jgi:hypothetical protein
MASLAAAGGVMPFSDDILAEIFIRLPTLEDLGRACASCPAFNRVITSHSFLRRLHALQPPSLLGFHSFSALFHPTEPPHPSAPAARAVAEAADFEFSFLPTRGFWMVRDARGGRFVLDCDDGTGATFTTIAVCDPLFRRHVLLPPLPLDLAAAVEQPVEVNGERRCDVFLAPCSEEEAEGQPEAFSVIWMALCPTKLVAFMFSSASWQWRALASSSWRDLNPAMPPVIKLKHSPLLCRSYAYGCFYWSLSEFPFRSKLIVLDVGRMEFYPVTHPSSHRLGEFAVVELGESRLGMFMLGDNTCDEYRIVRLFSASNQIHGKGASEWVLENTVSLYRSCSFNMLGVVDGKLLLQGAREHNSEEGSVCISLDFKTRQVQRVRGIIHSGFCPMVVQYIGYPPSLSLPTI